MTQELLPNSTSVFLGQYFYRQKTRDRTIDDIEIPINKIISSIIESTPKECVIKESDIKKFMENCKNITSILYNKYGFQKTTELDLEIYEMCLSKIDQSGLSNKNKDMLHYLLNSLRDYTLNIANISTREKELEYAYKQIDYVDFQTSLYGGLLAFVCIMVAILGSPVIQIPPDVLTLLINEGFRFASDIDSYIDTLDILTNPQELDLLKKSESAIK